MYSGTTLGLQSGVEVGPPTTTPSIDSILLSTQFFQLTKLFE
jgi:hypothetical protein